MKDAKFTTKLLSFAAVLAVAFAAVFAVPVSAEPDETYAIESYVPEESETTLQASDTAPSETQGEETTAPTGETQQSNTSESTTPPTETEPTYRALLPTIDNTQIKPPQVIGDTKEQNEPSLVWGFISWILIGVGVAVILAVVLSTKTKAYRGGRDRYSTTDKISGKKKLLPQDYYDNRKRR